jgi:hypothetical protein
LRHNALRFTCARRRRVTGAIPCSSKPLRGSHCSPPYSSCLACSATNAARSREHGGIFAGITLLIPTATGASHVHDPDHAPP